MKRIISTALLSSIAFSQSCNVESSIAKFTSPVAGKTFYLLNIKDLVVQETQLEFKSDNTVEAHFTLNANSDDCFNYKNTPSLSEKSITMHYSIDNDVLKIEELNLSVSTNQIDNENTFYKTSIVEHLNDSVGYKRIQAHAYSASLVDMYMVMINNNTDPVIIEKEVVENGTTRKMIYMNEGKNQNNPYKINPLGGNSN